MVPSTRKIRPSEGMMPRRHFRHSAQPCRVRASSGSAGTSLGHTTLTIEHADAEQRELNDAWPDGARIHVSDRAAELVGEHHQHERGRNQLRDRARRRDHAHGMTRRISVFDHRLHRDHAHGDDRGGDRAGDRAQDGADENHRIGQVRHAPGRTTARSSSSRSSASPQRSRIAPMNVKNGIASSRSLETIPNSW